MYTEKARINHNNRTTSISHKMNNVTGFRKLIFDDVRIDYKAKQKTNIRPVIQLCPYTRQQKIEIIRKLCEKHYGDTDKGEAEYYLNQMEHGIFPRIRNHNAIIRPWGDSFHIVPATFSGTGTMGRTLETGGAVATLGDAFSSYQLPARYTSQQIVSSESLANVGDRQRLNEIMGDSAYNHTQIPNSEYLHMIAHSLGGQDNPDNLMPGYHALNTAMVPIEAFVKYLTTIGYKAYYTVQFPPRVGPSIWVSEAYIKISFQHYGQDKEYNWRISIDSPDRLSQTSYNDICTRINAIKQELGLLRV